MKKAVALVIALGLVAFVNAQLISDVGPVYVDGKQNVQLGNVTVNGTLTASGAQTATSITATGTVQGEQLTSTDDAYVADRLGVGIETPDVALVISNATLNTVSKFISGNATCAVALYDSGTSGNPSIKVVSDVLSVIDGAGGSMSLTAGKPVFSGLGALNYGLQANAVAAGIPTNGLYHTNGIVKVVY